MDRTERIASFLRGVVAVLFSDCPPHFWRTCGPLRVDVLRLCPARNYGEPRLYTRHAVAQSRIDRPLFFSSLDRQSDIERIACRIIRDRICVIDQIDDGVDRGAALLSRLSEIPLEFVPAALALDLCRHRAVAFRDLVLACAHDRGEILPLSFFWRRWFSDHECGLVLEDRRANRDHYSHFDSLLPGDLGPLYDKIDNSRRCISLVVGGDDGFYFRSRLGEPSPVVSTAVCSNRCRLRRRQLRLVRDEPARAAL